jgi:peptidoglycan/LPS O-acetylase OafA/YrhL
MPVLAIAITLGVPPKGPVTLVICSMMTVAIASFSYRVLERPIRDRVARQLKRAEGLILDGPDVSARQSIAM